MNQHQDLLALTTNGGNGGKGKEDQEDQDGAEVIDTNALFKGQLIRIDQDPVELDWKLVPLFKVIASCAVNFWQVGFEQLDQRLVIRHGFCLTSKGQVGKNREPKYHPIEPKANRTVKQQALQEARRRYIDKQKEGYAPQGEELPAELNLCEPMLANKYKPPPPASSKSKSNLTLPASTMPKLNGIRALFRLDGGEMKVRSRSNNTFNHLDHIKSELMKFMSYLPPNSETDGELYPHENSRDMTFNVITSAVKTTKTVHPRNKDLKYYIFDLIEPGRMIWVERYTLLVNALTRYLEDGHTNEHFTIVQAYTANSHEEIHSQHDEFVRQGYEGIIIRRYVNATDKTTPAQQAKLIKESQYRPGRSNNLLKYKEFIDEEAMIIGAAPCIGGLEDGAIKFEMARIVPVTTGINITEIGCIKSVLIQGKVHRVIKGQDNKMYQVPANGKGKDTTLYIRPCGSISNRIIWMQQYLTAPTQFLGKLYTIRYQELSEDLVPIFPTGVGFRDYE